MQRIIQNNIPDFEKIVGESVYVYKNIIKRKVHLERSAEQATGTLKQIYGEQYDNYLGVTHEILQRLGVVNV